jgi:SAM-dependent methyltransferase
MSVIGCLHDRCVHGRRVRVLCDRLCGLIPPAATVLDVGCGDGLVASLIMDRRPDVTITGIDVLVRSDTRILVRSFDGHQIPFGDASFDVVMFVDVLHHTADPKSLLREAARVASTGVLIKDHRFDGFLAGLTLRVMDWVGNARFGVALPYNYWPEKAWSAAFADLDLKVISWDQDLHLYSLPADWIFGRSLHFVARLDVRASEHTLATSTARG